MPLDKSCSGLQHLRGGAAFRTHGAQTAAIIRDERDAQCLYYGHILGGVINFQELHRENMPQKFRNAHSPVPL